MESILSFAELCKFTTNFQILVKQVRSPCSISTCFISMVTFIRMSPSRTFPTPPRRRRTLCPLLISLSSFLCFNCCTVDNACSQVCVGQAIVQGDEGPVGGVAQVVHVHGVTVRHGEKQEEEVEKEVESEKEKNNTQGRRHMCMDGLKVKRQVRAALSKCEDVNKSSSATTDGMQVCSGLRLVRVYVRRVIHVIIQIALSVVENVLVVVHNVP